MKNFKGFGGWIEIFRGGKQTDSAGREHDGDAMIDRAIETFDPAHHEPPIVVGHPANNAPAFGWIENLKRVGDILMAKARDVVPEFEAIAKRGLYKKRSASFYPDGRLRHVGFLGAAPPAVKGLADLKFEENDDSMSFEFYDPGLSTVARLFRNMRDWLIEKEGKEAADAIIPDWDVEYIKDEANRDETENGSVSAFAGTETKNKEDAMKLKFSEVMEMFKFWKAAEENPDLEMPIIAARPAGKETPAFTEADLEAAKQAAADAERTKVEAEFAENARKTARETRGAEISDWCEGLVSEGKVLPAWVKLGIKEFCQKLDAETVIEFSDENKITALDWFKGFIAELPKTVEFKELAKRGDDVSGDAAGKLEILVGKKMKEDKSLDYSAAFSEVQREHPDLAREYASEITPKK